MWDARTGITLLELKGRSNVDTGVGHSGVVSSVSFNREGTRIVTGGWDGAVMVWDARPCQSDPSDHTRNAEELSYRLLHTRPNYRRYQVGYDDARAANDGFAALFYLDRLIELSTATDKPDDVKKWRAVRAKYPPAPLPVAPPPHEKR